MEWVETTAKSITEAQDRALDQLGVAADEAEFEILEEPKSGLFGRVRGEARVRARVRPTAVRPKQERRQRGRNQKRDGNKGGERRQQESNGQQSGGKQSGGVRPQQESTDDQGGTRSASESASRSSERPAKSSRSKQPRQNKEQQRMENERPASDVTPQEVGDAAVTFMSQLTTSFGVEGATTDLEVDGTDLDVRVTGGELGLMVGPGGRTLAAIQDLARVASQRRLGDHETRLRIDVGGYRERRREALEKFAATVASQVIESGAPKALEPMPSADRKAVHDAIIEIDGVTSHSEGDDPRRRVVISPA